MTSQPPVDRSRWALTRESFECLLSALDSDRDRAAEQYEVLRGRLLRFFEWQGVNIPEDCADEVLDVVARRLGDGVAIHNVHGFCAGVARNVLLAHRRRQITRESLLRRFASDAAVETARAAPRERELHAFEGCLARLPAEDRDLVLAYYRTDPPGLIRNRKNLADRLGIPPGALRLRSHRLRMQLAQCLHRALAALDGGA